MSISRKQDDYDGFWTMTVGEREASLQALERAIVDQGGDPSVCLGRFRSDQRYAARIAEQMLLDIVLSTLDGVERARVILGDDFIGPEGIAKARGVGYCASQHQQLLASVPSDDVLRSLKEQGYALVAGPPEPMTLLDVRDVNPTLFPSKKDGWYVKDKQCFARKETVGCGWIAIRKEIVPNSMFNTWGEQNALLGIDETVPNAAAFAWFVTTYYAARNVRLFGSVYARVSSVTADGSHVSVGHFDEDGLNAYDCWDDYRCDALGVSSARKV